MKSQSNREIQSVTLEVLKEFILICENLKLRYYFTGGALIGVLRHKGFVPWDDDVDVGMPRRDYNKFVAYMLQSPVDGFGICNRKNDSNWHFDLSQFVDLNSEIEIHLAKKKRKAHVWIDIFPLDGLPTNKVCRYIHMQHIMVDRYLIQLANIDVQVDAHRKRPRYETIFIKAMKKIGSVKNLV